MSKIKIVEISFKENDTLILLESEHKNMLQSSIDYGFDLKDNWICKLKEINPKDFPNTEWNG
jgi:hypothetical protein